MAWREGLREKVRSAESEVTLPAGFQARLKARLERVETAAERGRWAATSWAGRLFRGLGLAACLLLACLPLLLRSQGHGFQLSQALAEHHAACWALPANSQCATDVAHWNEKHNGPQVRVPLKDGFVEKERRICPFGEVGLGPHLLLHDPKGRQASLFILPIEEADGKVPQSLEAYQMGSQTVAIWHSPKWAFALVAAGAKDEVTQWIQPALGSEQPWRILAGH
ncbi:MAG: hypothetical protein KF760_00350 [Candidatus Eremiobacteraeota bacterium]|nr:hypothetical protein [Candidatus Eremiobacteraeota bacterium]MCW5871748.1 hypothetical protein [Candidatus Eremiobacteraeota bacterium]